MRFPVSMKRVTSGPFIFCGTEVKRIKKEPSLVPMSQRQQEINSTKTVMEYIFLGLMSIIQAALLINSNTLYGFPPYEKASHMVTPKLQTSLLLENLWKFVHSGAYHFSGHFPPARACARYVLDFWPTFTTQRLSLHTQLFNAFYFYVLFFIKLF